MARLSLFSLPRLLGAFAFRRQLRGLAELKRSAPVEVATRDLLQDKFAANLAGGDDLDRLVSDLLKQGRVALLLRPQLTASVHEKHLQHAQDVLDETMSLVPGGDVALHSRWYETGHQETIAGQTLVHVDSVFLDRYAVSNRDFQNFVAAGGYEQMDLWEAAIWPAMVELVDQSRHPGPRYWCNGQHPELLADHPVVGISWYEASAYARWIGKRLPTDAEWVKAGVWPVGTGGMPQQRRYPWGDMFDRSLANVWEWTSTHWGAWEPPSKKTETIVPMRSLRGGAFDTYFDNQAACQFQSGDDPLARRHNVGFRCALSWGDVASQAPPVINN